MNHARKSHGYLKHSTNIPLRACNSKTFYLDISLQEEIACTPTADRKQLQFLLKPFGLPKGTNNSNHSCTATDDVYGFPVAEFLGKPMDHITESADNSLNVIACIFTTKFKESLQKYYTNSFISS